MTAKTYSVEDFFPLPATQRVITDEGFMVVPGVLARTGIQLYRAYEFGLDKEMGIDPMKIMKLYRPPEEVFQNDSMKSFENKPLTVNHPKGLVVTADNWQELGKGEMRDLVQEGDKLKGTLIVKAKDAIESIMSGKVQLSMGYSFSADWTPGTTADGAEYDGVQKNIRGNHIALVDAARCGSACRIADSNLSTTGDSTMTMQKVIVDGIPLEVSESAAAAINKLIQQVADTSTSLKEAQDKFDAELSKIVTAKDSEIEALKKDVMTPVQRDAMVADWAKMLDNAKKLAPKVSTDGKTCHVIRQEVVAAVVAGDARAKAAADAILNGKEITAADQETVRSVFNVLAATAVTEKTQQQTGDADKLSKALAATKKAADASAKPCGRDAMLARQAEAWKTK